MKLILNYFHSHFKTYCDKIIIVYRVQFVRENWGIVSHWLVVASLYTMLPLTSHLRAPIASG